MPKAKVTVTMEKDKDCKSCKRFRAKGTDADKVSSSFYLQNPASEELGNPEKIRISVEAG